MANKQISVPISRIRTNPVALREVSRDSEAYQNLVHDVGRRGILLPLTAMEKHDEATDEVFYQLVDGLHRFSAAQDNDLQEIPINVLDIDESEVVETQIVANLVKVDTKPVQYTEALRRMLAARPTMSISELAEKISQSTQFVMQRFSLLKLDDSIQKLVDDGEIKLANAYALAKMPKEHQHEWTDSAIAQPPSEFVPACQQRIKELNKAQREGREAKSVEYEPQARLRKLSELKDEQKTGELAAELTAEFNCKTAKEGFELAVAWALQLDPHSIEAGRAKWEAAREAREEEKKRRAAIREEAKRREAAEKAEKARSESGLSEEEIEKEVARIREEKERQAQAKAEEAEKSEEEVKA